MKTVRELHGKTLEETAPRLGISASMLSLIEREKSGVSQHILKRWKELFFFEEGALRGGVLAWSVFTPSQHGAGKITRTG